MLDEGMKRFPGELPLNEAKEGWMVEVASYRSNGRQAQRLAELGLTPGTLVRILRNGHGQPLLLQVRSTYLAIDRKMAGMLSIRVLGPSRSDRHRRWGWRKRGRGSKGSDHGIRHE